ncbi:peptidylprolyl isomerase [Bacillus salitolerans]|uniref:peptidylprolyl isomerase n=1 Tax=Bacillus salitolerans TaxID=1437434 RepID=A0ABW4LTD1_9BACI
MSLLKERRKYVVLFGIIIIGIVIAGFTLSKKDVVASVDGNSITKEELYNRMAQQYGAQTLDAIITDKVIQIEADKNDIEISVEEIENEMQTIISSYGGEDLFNEALKTSGVTIDDVKNDVEVYLKTEKMLAPRISITDEDITTYFNENKDLFREEEQVKASHILVENESLANELREKIMAGEEFAEIAREYSTDSSNADQGGDLGYFAKGVMAPEFEEVAFSLHVDELSQPVETEYGFHLIKVDDKLEAKEASLEEHKDDIKETLYNQKLSSEYSIWLEEIIGKYEIKDYLN